MIDMDPDLDICAVGMPIDLRYHLGVQLQETDPPPEQRKDSHFIISANTDQN